MKEGKQRRKDQFEVVIGMKKDGTWDVQRRNNGQERKYVITSPQFSSLSMLTTATIL